LELKDEKVKEDQTPQRPGYMQVAPTNREFYQRDQPARRPFNHPSGQTKSRATAVRRTDFLNTSFSPILGKQPKLSNNETSIEQGFFKSLSQLAAYYQIDAGDFSKYPYPVNLLKAESYLRIQLCNLNLNLQLSVKMTADQSLVLSTEQNIWCGSKLYYLPVEPLYKMLFEKSVQRSYELLLSVFAYFYQSVGVSHFREQSSYLYWTYDMISDWMMDDDCETRQGDVEADFDYMSQGGDTVLAEIMQDYHLDEFEKRTNQYRAENPAEQAIHQVAKLALSLKAKYPDRKFSANIKEHVLDDYDYGVITPENYLCFFWSAEGHIYDQLWDTVNTDLQEFSYKDKPIIKTFNGKKISKANYDFEAGVLNLMDELCDVINAIAL
jgi:hypothetical protein